MLYKLVMITDLDGKEKTETEAVNRLGRILDLNIIDIHVGERCFMTCVDPGYMKSIITSNVQNVVQADDGLIITTEHSIYLLVDVEIVYQYEEAEYWARVEMAEKFDMNGDPICC